MENDFKNSFYKLATTFRGSDIRIIDSSWYFPQRNRNAEQNF